MTSSIEGAQTTSGLTTLEESSAVSLKPLAARLAALQLSMAAEQKAEANEVIRGIQSENAKLSKAREVLALMRRDMSDGDKEVRASIKEFCNSNNVTMPSGSMKKEKWEILIKNMEGFIESRGTDTQTKMVQLEDLMGKYNAWSQGASKTFSDTNQVLQSILTR